MQVSYWLGEMGKPWYKMSHHLGTEYPGVLGGKIFRLLGTECPTTWVGK